MPDSRPVRLVFVAIITVAAGPARMHRHREPFAAVDTAQDSHRPNIACGGRKCKHRDDAPSTALSWGLRNYVTARIVPFMKVRVSKLIEMLRATQAEEKAARIAAKAEGMKQRRKEVSNAVMRVRRQLEQMEAALKADDTTLLREFSGLTLYSARGDYTKPKESTVDRALRVLALSSEEEITLAEAARLVGDAIKL